jgi:1-acyl-sn-glycerol-3-phosphate acyltransferase
MKKSIAVLKIIVLLLWTIPNILFQCTILLFHKGRYAYLIPQLWHKVACSIIGLKIIVIGTPVCDKQVIYISNHLSYLDIPATGCLLKASFIAKDDIAGWPVIGFLATIQQTAFISRSSSKAKKVANALETMIKNGKSLVLFPEGTSSTGETVLPFKSSLFSIAQPKDMKPIPIQPLIIDLVDVDGKPITKENRDIYAWYADMDFAPHFWKFLQTGGATVKLTFLEVIIPTPDQNRKELCQMVEQKISSGLKPT